MIYVIFNVLQDISLAVTEILTSCTGKYFLLELNEHLYEI
jgi:hypothetical protein